MPQGHTGSTGRSGTGKVGSLRFPEQGGEAERAGLGSAGLKNSGAGGLKVLHAVRLQLSSPERSEQTPAAPSRRRTAASGTRGGEPSSRERDKTPRRQTHAPTFEKKRRINPRPAQVTSREARRGLGGPGRSGGAGPDARLEREQRCFPGKTWASSFYFLLFCPKTKKREPETHTHTHPNEGRGKSGAW